MRKYYDYLFSILNLIVGNGAAQLLPVILSPTIARIYTPEEFGVFVILVSTCALSSLIASGQLELAIVKVEGSRDENGLVYGIITISLFASILYFFLLLVIKSYISSETFEKLWLFIPIGTFFNALYHTQSYLLLKYNFLKLLSVTKIVYSSFFMCFSALFYICMKKVVSLEVTYLVGVIISIFPLIYFILSKRIIGNPDEIKSVVIRNLDFPKRYLPGAVLNNLTNQLVLLSMPKLYEKFVVGNYSLVNRVLVAPSSVISTAVGQIFFRETSLRLTDNNRINFKKDIYLNSLGLLAIGIIIYLPLYFYGDNLIIFFFGDQWILAGDIIRIVALGSLVRFIVSPITNVLITTNNLKILSSWQVLYFFSILLTILFFKDDNVILFIKRITVVEVVLYIVYYFLAVKYSTLSTK